MNIVASASNSKSGTLNNGIRYIYNHTENSSSVAILIVVRYGSGFDKKSGLAHLLEHILFKGTKKRPLTKNIMAELNSIGSEYNAYTSRTFTGYHSKTAYIHLEQGLDIISDLILNTDFYTKNFLYEYEQEKKIVVEELKAIRDNNIKYVLELIDKNVFKGKLSDNSDDDINTISSITLDDIIETYNKYYVGSNIIVSINGNLGKHKNSIETLLYKYLGGFKKGTPNNTIFGNQYFNNNPKINNIITVPNAIKAVVSLTYKDTGFYSRTKYYMLELFRLVFSDLTSGRLFQEIREKQGLVYSIKSVHYSYDYLGYLCIRTNTDIKNIDKLVIELKKQINLVKNNGLTLQEFEIAKKNYISKLLMDLENTMTLSEYNAYELFYHSDNYMPYNNIVDLINDIKLEELNSFIKKLLSNDGILTIIRPV